MGRALVVLFLALREQHVISQREAGRFEWFGRTFRPAPPIARNLTTLFGVVHYWRTYMREVVPFKRRGFYPLDLSLGLTRDRFSWNVLVQAVRLATELKIPPPPRGLTVRSPHHVTSRAGASDGAGASDTRTSCTRGPDCGSTRLSVQLADVTYRISYTASSVEVLCTKVQR